MSRQITLTEKISITLAMTGIGIAIVLTGVTGVIEYINRYDAITSYSKLLISEMNFNLIQSSTIISEHDKGTPLTLVPEYRSVVYEAGLGTDGYFFALDDRTQLEVQAFYALAATDDKSIQMFASEPDAHEKAIYGQALAINQGLGSLVKNVHIKKSYLTPIYLNIALMFVGGVLIVLSILILYYDHISDFFRKLFVRTPGFHHVKRRKKHQKKS